MVSRISATVIATNRQGGGTGVIRDTDRKTKPRFHQETGAQRLRRGIFTNESRLHSRNSRRSRWAPVYDWSFLNLYAAFDTSRVAAEDATASSAGASTSFPGVRLCRAGRSGSVPFGSRGPRGAVPSR